MTAVVLMSSLRVEVHDPASLLVITGPRAELEADAFLRRLAQATPTEGRWRLRLQATSAAGLELACDVELEAHQFVPFRDLLAAGLVLRSKAGFLQHKEDLDAAESLVGQPVYPGKGPRGAFWVPPKGVRPGEAQVVVLQVPFVGVAAKGDGLTFSVEGPDAEDDATIALGQWLDAKPQTWAPHYVAFQIALADGKRLQATLAMYRAGFGKGVLRRTLVRHLMTRSGSLCLTDSHRRVLAMLAQHISDGASFLALHAPPRLTQFRCPCATRVPTRTARLAGASVQVPSLHGINGQVCKFAEEAYRDLDPVPTSTTLQLGDEVTDVEAWWQAELRAQDIANNRTQPRLPTA